jgi:hypothetical protein
MAAGIDPKVEMAWRSAVFAVEHVAHDAAALGIGFAVGEACGGMGAAGLESSGSLQVGQRLAKPGLSGFSSNSSPQTAQVRIGKDIFVLVIGPELWPGMG